MAIGKLHPIAFDADFSRVGKMRPGNAATLMLKAVLSRLSQRHTRTRKAVRYDRNSRALRSKTSTQPYGDSWFPSNPTFRTRRQFRRWTVLNQLVATSGCHSRTLSVGWCTVVLRGHEKQRLQRFVSRVIIFCSNVVRNFCQRFQKTVVSECHVVNLELSIEGFPSAQPRGLIARHVGRQRPLLSCHPKRARRSSPGSGFPNSGIASSNVFFRQKPRQLACR